MGEQPTGGLPDFVGKQLGQYEVIRKLGDGGMATVYLARQQSIGRTVAIKMLPPHFMHDPTFMQRFEAEVKIAAELQHPRVLPVYDYGQVEGRPFIVMAHMAGGTLADRIKQGSMPLDEIVRLVSQIAEGLDHAHAKGVVHRDFKPSNVLLDENGNAYLADFGISKITESTINLTGSGVVGTPAYMAPEMSSEGIVAPSVDIYALGVTLFQMLTSKYPYNGETPLRVMMAHVTSPVPDVRVERPDLPEAIALVLQQAMAKRPQERYQTAGELAAALREAARETGLEMDYTPTQPEPSPAVPQTPSEVPYKTIPTPTPPPTGDEGWQTAPSTPSSPMQGAEAPRTPAPQAPVQRTPAPQTPPPAAAPPQKKRGFPWLLVLGGGGVLLLALVGCIAAFFLLDIPSLFNDTPPVVEPVTAEVNPATEEVLIPATEELVEPLVTEQVVQPTEPVDPGVGGDVLTFDIENLSSTAICHVLMSPSDSDTWGGDQLDGEPIEPGSSFTLTDVPMNIYDYQALDCEQNIIDEHYGVDLSTKAFIWTIRDANDVLMVINNSSYTICTVYATSSEDGFWGSNRLPGEQPIISGNGIEILLPTGTFDLRAEACDADIYWEEYQQAVEGGYEWTLTD